MKNKHNPFVSMGYRDPKHFCDREDETRQLNEFMMQGVHVALFAIRRLGKTGLIHHVFYPYRKNSNVTCVYMDILASNHLADFVNQLATTIYNQFPKQSAFGKKAMALLQSLRPTISFDELTGNPTLSLTLETQEQKAQTVSNLLHFLDQQGERIIFAIDEFQQILLYPEKNVEALLRTSMQHMQNTSFIFSGSNQKMMHEIFNAAKRPFFATCMPMQLDFISKEAYSEFITKKFQENKRSITQESVDFICEWTRRHTFFTQYVCATVFAKHNDQIVLDDVREVANRILKLSEPNYHQYKNLLTSAQWNLLCAIAKAEQVHHPQSKKFIETYKLGTPALVKRGLDALLDKELIFFNSSVEEPYYEVYDKFLMRWIQHTQR